VISERQSQTVALFPVLLVNFIGTLGFSIVLPFLVFVVLRFGGNALVYGIVGATSLPSRWRCRWLRSWPSTRHGSAPFN
jgi:hypothetical protein